MRTFAASAFLATTLAATACGSSSEPQSQPPGWTVTTLSGLDGADGFVANGSPTPFYGPTGLACDGQTLFVTTGGYVQRVDLATGRVTRLVPTSSIYSGCGSLAVAGGALFAVVGGGPNSAGTIVRIDANTGQVTPIAGGLQEPCGIAVVGPHLYVADGNAVRRVTIASGAVSTLFETSTPLGMVAMDGLVYFTAGGELQSWNPATGTGALLGMLGPERIGLAALNGKLYACGTRGSAIEEVILAPFGRSTIAGGSTAGRVDGPGDLARFATPRGLASDGRHLYVADFGNGAIRRLTPP